MSTSPSVDPSVAASGDAVPTGNTYDKYGSTNSIEQKMMQRFLATLESMIGRCPDRPQRVLEVGVGEGEVMTRVREWLPDASVVGLDLDDEELAGHWRSSGLPCMFGDATSLPFADNTFDLVLAMEVLEHVPGPQRALAEMQRVCAGSFIASVPFEPIWRAGNMARRRYLSDWGNTPGHVNHWTRWGFRSFVATEFDVAEVASPLPWTMVRGRTR
jgi:SAM-dependent methyltransferase